MKPDAIRAELLDALDPYQREAVVALEGPVLVVAGPGSGKTRVLTHRLAALVDAGIYPSRLLAVTFTNKAAKEMKQRLALLIGDSEADRATVSTFHSVCAKILRYYAESAGLPARFTILDADDALRVVTAVCDAVGHTTGMPANEAKQVARSFYSDISRAKNAAKTPGQLAASGSIDDQATAEVMAAYNAELARMGAVDFDDLLLRVLALLQNVPQVAQQLRKRWQFVCVDEFQDTNAVQYEIVANLVADHGNLCVVGDADQSIYAFRGARPAVVSSFTRDYPKAKVVILERNYRSTSNICEVSKSIIAPNEAVFRAKQEPVAAKGDSVCVHSFSSDLDEAGFVVSKILQRGGPLSEHAVLVRTNALTRPIEQALNKALLSYDVVGAVRFVERAEVRDAASWLFAAINPNNWIAFERSVSAPKRGIGPSALEKVHTFAQDQGVDYIAACEGVAKQGASRQANSLQDYATKVYNIAELADTQGPTAALKFIIESCGVGEMVAQKDAREGTARQENLDQLLAMSKDQSTGDPAKDTEEFLERLSLVSSEDDTQDPFGKVQILTMHSAKGKEFDHVYVVGVEEEVLPHIRALSEGEDAIAEERRLFFVAASRAKKTLDISWCSTRMRFGSLTTAKQSTFLASLPESVTYIDNSFTKTTKSSLRRSSTYTPAPTASVWEPARSKVTPARPSTVDPEAIKPGVRVRHKKFGDGVVESTHAGTAVIAFSEGKKNLMLSVAPLTILN